MILGIGIDWVETSRIERSLERFGERFINRVFVSSEVEYCQGMKSPGRHFAARFAAKEAVSKAFGTGIGKALGWRDIEVRRHPTGQPFVVLNGNGRLLAQERGVRQVFVSLTHHETASAAVALLVGDGGDSVGDMGGLLQTEQP
jgi:holo-[acyl-carrier protein] synthase